jgi:hypothetical protein
VNGQAESLRSHTTTTTTKPFSPKQVRVGYFIKMAKIVVGSPSLTQPLLLYPDLGLAMLRQHRQSYEGTYLSKWFYDTSLDTAARAARGDSLIGGTKALHARGVSHE